MGDDLGRRKFLLGLGAASGLVLAGCRPWRFHHGHGGPPRARRARRPTRIPGGPRAIDLLPQIEHIVIYMQENHSYDSYFGMLHRGDGYRVRDGVPTNSNVDLDGTRRARCSTRPTRARAGEGVSQSWVADPPPDRRRADGRLPLRRQHQRHALLGRHRPALLLVAREHVPAVRPLVRVGTRADVPEPHVPPGRHVRRTWSRPTRPRRSRCPTRRAARSGTSSTRYGISWLDYAWDLPDIALVPEDVRPRTSDKIRTFPQFLADCHARHAAGRLDREPGRHRVHRGEPARHPARRGVQRVDHQRGDAQPGVAEDRAALHVRRARRLLRPRPAAGRDPARRHRAGASTPTPDAPAAWDQLRPARARRS